MPKKIQPLLLFMPLMLIAFAGIAQGAFTVGVNYGNANPVVLVDDAGASIGASNPLDVSASFSPATVTTVTDDSLDVATAGTPEALSGAPFDFVRCVVQAKEGNTDIVVIGSATVDATEATRTGAVLTPLASLTLENGDLANYYADVESNGDGVTIYCES